LPQVFFPHHCLYLPFPNTYATWTFLRCLPVTPFPRLVFALPTFTHTRRRSAVPHFGLPAWTSFLHAVTTSLLHLHTLDTVPRTGSTVFHTHATHYTHLPSPGFFALWFITTSTGWFTTSYLFFHVYAVLPLDFRFVGSRCRSLPLPVYGLRSVHWFHGYTYTLHRTLPGLHHVPGFVALFAHLVRTPCLLRTHRTVTPFFSRFPFPPQFLLGFYWTPSTFRFTLLLMRSHTLYGPLSSLPTLFPDLRYYRFPVSAHWTPVLVYTLPPPPVIHGSLDDTLDISHALRTHTTARWFTTTAFAVHRLLPVSLVYRHTTLRTHTIPHTPRILPDRAAFLHLYHRTTRFTIKFAVCLLGRIPAGSLVLLLRSYTVRRSVWIPNLDTCAVRIRSPHHVLHTVWFSPHHFSARLPHVYTRGSCVARHHHNILDTLTPRCARIPRSHVVRLPYAYRYHFNAALSARSAAFLDHGILLPGCTVLQLRPAPTFSAPPLSTCHSTLLRFVTLPHLRLYTLHRVLLVYAFLQDTSRTHARFLHVSFGFITAVYTPTSTTAPPPFRHTAWFARFAFFSLRTAAVHCHLRWFTYHVPGPFWFTTPRRPTVCLLCLPAPHATGFRFAGSVLPLPSHARTLTGSTGLHSFTTPPVSPHGLPTFTWFVHAFWFTRFTFTLLFTPFTTRFLHVLRTFVTPVTLRRTDTYIVVPLRFRLPEPHFTRFHTTTTRTRICHAHAATRTPPHAPHYAFSRFISLHAHWFRLRFTPFRCTTRTPHVPYLCMVLCVLPHHLRSLYVHCLYYHALRYSRSFVCAPFRSAVTSSARCHFRCRSVQHTHAFSCTTRSPRHASLSAFAG